jgi:diaminopimelate epimerase
MPHTPDHTKTSCRFCVVDASGNRTVFVDTRRDRTQDVPRLLSQLVAYPFASQPEMYCAIAAAGDDVCASFMNPDGTEENMCGNAVRAVPMVMSHWDGFARPEIRVRTRFGDVTSRMNNGTFSADFAESDIRVAEAIDGGLLVDVGTPHLVRRVKDLQCGEVERLGAATSRGPQPLNATFVEFSEAKPMIHARTFERGVGETASCGTGAIAAMYGGRAFGGTFASATSCSQTIKFTKSGVCLDVSRGGGIIRLSGSGLILEVGEVFLDRNE